MKKHTLAMLCGIFLVAQNPLQSSPFDQAPFTSIQNLSEKLENIQNYYEALNIGDYPRWIRSMTSDAVINHPIYGKSNTNLSRYFKETMVDRPGMKIVVKNIFQDPNDPNTIAVNYVRSFSAKEEKQQVDEGMAIFTFTSKNNKIHTVTIIYDSQKTKEAVQENQAS